MRDTSWFGDTEMVTGRSDGWVVYRMPVPGKPAVLTAVCRQAQWDALSEAARGRRTLVRAGIPTEGEAERLARGTAGDAVPSAARKPMGFTWGNEQLSRA